MRAFTILRLAILIGLLAMPSAASAATETTRLTYVPAIDLEVRYIGKKNQWCAPRLDLILITSKPDGFQNNKLLDIQFGRLVRKLKKACPVLLKVGIIGYSRGEPDLALAHGSYLEKDNWRFSNEKLPALAAVEPAPKTSRTSAENTPPAAPETGKSEKTAPVPQQPTIPFKQYRDANDPDQFETGHQLALRLAHHHPALLDNKERLLDWLKHNATDKKSSTHAQASALLEAYNAGSAAEKTTALAHYRRLIEAEISVRKTEFAKAVPLYFRLPYRISADYQQGIGFPVEPYRSLSKWQHYSSKDGGPSMRSKTGINLINAYAPVSWAGDITSIPVFDERKIAIMAKLLAETKRYRFELRLYARFNWFSSSDKISPRMRARNRLDRVAVEMFDLKTPGTPPKLVYKWDITADDGKGAASLMPVVDFAKWAGIPTLKGRLVLQGWKNRHPPNALIPFPKELKLIAPNKGWARFANLMAIKQSPELLDNEQNALTIARIFLNNREKAALILNRQEDSKQELNATDKDTLKNSSFLDHGKDGISQGLYDELQYDEFLKRFRKENYAARAYRYLPKFPIPVIDLKPVLLGDYDDSQQLFPLLLRDQNGRWNAPDWQPQLQLSPYRHYDLRRYPKTLKLSPANATKLAGLITKIRPKVTRLGLYLALFSELQSVEKDDKATGQYDVVTKRAALYLDKDLKQKVVEIPIQHLTGDN